MKIIFSTDQVFLHGGIEKVLAEKANYFADVLHYEVYIVTTEQQKRLPCYALSNKIKCIDLGVNYDREKSYFSPSNLLKIPFHYKQLKKILTTIKPDVMIVVNFAFDFYWLPFMSKEIPKLKEFHSSRYFEHQLRNNASSVLQKLKYRLNDWLESKYDRLILLNPDERQFYKSTNSVVIPNPISIPDAVAQLSTKQVVAAGRIAPVKGFDKLIDAWSIVFKHYPDWELHIYGEDYIGTKEILVQQIKENGLQNTVFFKGTSSNMPETMLSYSAYAMSSTTECFPMVLLEALSVGLPTVSFDCPTGPKNIISHLQDGLIVKDQDSAALSAALLHLIEDTAFRKKLGERAKENSAKFATTAIMSQWQHLFQNL